MDRTLFQLIKALNESGIRAAARPLSDGRVELWLGDAGGIRASALFTRPELNEAARWLKTNAVAIFPDSRFARVQRTMDGWSGKTVEP